MKLLIILPDLKEKEMTVKSFRLHREFGTGDLMITFLNEEDKTDVLRVGTWETSIVLEATD